jgi:hypothetical protein
MGKIQTWKQLLWNDAQLHKQMIVLELCPGKTKHLLADVFMDMYGRLATVVAHDATAAIRLPTSHMPGTAHRRL